MVADAPDRQCWAKAGRRAVLGKGRPAGGVGQRPAGGRCWAAAAADLVHGSPQPLVLPSLLHQVSGAFRCAAAADLVHESPQNLVLPFPLHQVSGHFRRAAAADLVHESPHPLVLPSPLHQVSGAFRRAAAADLVHEFPQPLVLPSPLHQVSGHFRCAPADAAPLVTFSKSKVDKCAILLYHSFCQLLELTG